MMKIGITQGDLNGIGSEVIIKALLDSRMCELGTMIIYGSSKAISFYRKGIEGAENFSINVIKSAKEARSKSVNLIEFATEDVYISVGAATPESGSVAVKALQAATDDLKEGVIDVLVTAPINKESVQSDTFKFTGHTEFLADKFGGEPLMVLCSDVLKVGLVTVHLPVAEIAKAITKEKIVTKLQQVKKMLTDDFGVVAPKIAVLSLNPHAGDGGLLGEEEKNIIKPAIEEAYKDNILAFGPFAADGFFAAGNYAKYDAVLAMYHDQGLAPFKTISPDGVNYTASLPIVRTSPDHGVGYDIAGKDSANEQSMRNAMYMAIDIFNTRKQIAEMRKNPLKRNEREKGRDVSVRDLPEATE